MRHYQQQYADMYFLRLARLKPVVAEIAAAAWEGYNVCVDRAVYWDCSLRIPSALPYGLCKMP